MPRKSDELYVPYLRRRTNYALDLFVRNGYTSAVCRVLDKIWTMATAVALPSSHRCCLISQLLPSIVDWRDTLFWVHLKETADALGLNNISGWRHPRRGRRSTCWGMIILSCYGVTCARMGLAGPVSVRGPWLCCGVSKMGVAFGKMSLYFFGFLGWVDFLDS